MDKRVSMRGRGRNGRVSEIRESGSIVRPTILRIDNRNVSNYPEWFEYLKLEIPAKYGKLGSIIEHGRHSQPEAPIHPSLTNNNTNNNSNVSSVSLSSTSVPASTTPSYAMLTRSRSSAGAGAGAGAAAASGGTSVPSQPSNSSQSAQGGTQTTNPPGDPPTTVAIAATTTTETIEVQMWKIDYAEYVKEKRKYEENMFACYYFILSTISASSRDRLEASEHWGPVNARQDPLPLFELLRDIHLGPTDALPALNKMRKQKEYNDIRQGPDESLREYNTRFEHALDGLKAVKVDAPENEMIILHFIEGLNDKYEQFRSNLLNLAISKATTIPEDRAGVIALANVYVPIGKQFGSLPPSAWGVVAEEEEEKKGRGGGGRGRGRGRGRGGRGSTSASALATTATAPAPASAPAPAPAPASAPAPGGAIKSGVTCYLCNRPGHKKDKCPNAKVIADAIQKLEKDGKINVAVAATCEMMEPTGVIDPGAVMWDTGATHSIFGQKELLKEVQECEPITFKGLGEGKITCTEAGEFQGIPSVYYSPESKMNILSGYAAVEQGCRVEYDEQGQCSVITPTSDVIHFKAEEWLYVNRPLAMVATVANNEKAFSKRDVEMAKKVVSIARRLGVPSSAALKQVIASGACGDKALSIRHVDIATQIYGADVASLVAKSKEPRPIQYKMERVTQAQVQELTFFSDLMFLEKETFLITVVKPIGLLINTYLGNARGSRSKSSITSAIKSQVYSCRAHNFRITTIFFDGEGAVGAALTSLNLMGIKTISKPGTHMGEVESANRTIKEWVRGVYLSLPYTLPAELVRHLVDFSVQRLNLMESKRGLAGIPAVEAFDGVKVNMDRDASLGFGTYCHTVTPNIVNKNSITIPRTQEAIALKQHGRNGSVVFLNMKTRHLMVRNEWKVLPMPESKIQEMNQWSSQMVIDLGPPESGEHNGDLIMPELPEPQFVEHVPIQDEVEKEYDPIPGVSESSTLEKALREGTTEAMSNMTIKEGITLHGETAEKSILGEWTQLKDKGVFEYCKGKVKKKPIGSFMFLTEKKDPKTGELVKVKSRAVAMGNQQMDGEIWPSSSPTVSLSSLLMTATVAKANNMFMATMDVGGAYLNADMPEGLDVYIRIDKENAEYLMKIDPEAREFIRSDGTLIARLRKALYGCHESAKLWYDTISNFLKRQGFEETLDECVFVKVEGNNRIIVTLYVDDMLIGASTEDMLREFKEAMIKEYKEVTYKEGKVLTFLGMVLDFSGEELKITMEKYVEDIVSGKQLKHYVSPAAEDLLSVTESPRLSKEGSKEFHSMVAKLLYLAIRARPDILLAVNFLTSRVAEPTEKDKVKLDRVLGYLSGTKELGITLKANLPLCVEGYIDASFYSCKETGVSRSGVYITLGGGPIYTKTERQKMVVKSAWEAELMAVSDHSSQVIWCKNFLKSLVGDEVKAIVYQDNTATIASMRKGRPTNAKARHVDLKHFWLKQEVDNSVIDLKYQPTGKMIADYFTKPLQGDQFRVGRERLLGG